MSDVLYGITEAMGVVVGGVDAPAMQEIAKGSDVLDSYNFIEIWAHKTKHRKQALPHKLIVHPV